MVFQGVSSDNSNASNLNQINDLARTVASSERTQIFKDDAGTRRVLLGKGLNDFYGLKVSPEGQDVYDATDDQLIFNSDQNVFKIVDKITIVPTIPGAGTVTTTTQAHGLSYIPALVGYIIVSGAYYQLPFVSVLPATGVVVTSLQLSADATNVIVTWTSPAAWVGAAPTLSIYLLQETAN